MDRVLSDTPLHKAFIEGGAIITRLRGPELYLEAGARPAPGLALFGRAYARQDDQGAMAGFRWTF